MNKVKAVYLSLCQFFNSPMGHTGFIQTIVMSHVSFSITKYSLMQQNGIKCVTEMADCCHSGVNNASECSMKRKGQMRNGGPLISIKRKKKKKAIWKCRNFDDHSESSFLSFFNISKGSSPHPYKTTEVTLSAFKVFPGSWMRTLWSIMLTPHREYGWVVNFKVVFSPGTAESGLNSREIWCTAKHTF